jgi:ribosomal protein S18 acetylase RimI-like enzyme
MTCSRSGNRSTITTPPSPELRELGPRRTLEASWSVRRDLYVGLLPEPDAFVLFAEVDSDSAAVGYGLVHMPGPEQTWATGDRVAELETLAVPPGHRGGGVGSALRG